jgi:hypothetical protein
MPARKEGALLNVTLSSLLADAGIIDFVQYLAYMRTLRYSFY